MLLTLFYVFIFLSSTYTLPLSEFFPFGPEVGDSTAPPNDDESVGPLLLPLVFPYFDHNHHRIWVANNGLFSFLSPISEYVPSQFPLANESRLVAGFWTDIDTRGTMNGTGNKVYYQIYDKTIHSNLTLSIFQKTKNYVGRFFPQQYQFEPNMVIIGTWYRVGAYSRQTNLLNTFQVVLSTDGDLSFVFFLYYDLQWAQSSNNSNSYAQAGFNAGDGITFQMLPHSRTEDIVRLVNESNVNIPGLFAFRVDTDNIDSGGCTSNVSVISFRPRTNTQLGSTAIRIYGPCFTNATKVQCRFGSSPTIIDGIIIDEFLSICLTPFASMHGSVSIGVSIDNGNTFISAGTFNYAPVQFGSDEVTIESEDGDKLLNDGQHIKLKWYFPDMIRNIFPNDTRIDIELWKVRLDQQSHLQKENQPILLQKNLSLTNSSRIKLPSSIFYVSTCFIRVVARFKNITYAGLNTGLLIVRSHSSKASELCQTWSHQQPEPSTWNRDGLLPCPMTRWQAIAAGRCCYEPDQQCRKDSANPNNCWLHRARSGYNEPSAVECFLSITSNSHGAQTECCYDIDGMIITRGTGAGTDNRHQQSKASIQHFFHDTLPYLQCCVMVRQGKWCNKYMYFRPPRRGSPTRNEYGAMWGDPHLQTLDGTSYTFNGYGEYIYLAISNGTSSPNTFNTMIRSNVFMSQIRTVPIASGNATVTKGFAAQSGHNEDQSISITISRREHLIVRRGNESLEFEDNIHTLFFPEMTIRRLDGNNKNRLTISWTIGVTIEIDVIEMTSPSKALVLNIAASVSEVFRGRTYGLLGTYDGVESNDLRSRNGTIISSNASLERIHKDFGVTWAIDPSSSLFYYEKDQSAKLFEEKNRVFIPSFIDPTTTDNSSIRHSCNIDVGSLASSWTLAQNTCYYDLSMTKDISFAKTSLKMGEELLLVHKYNRNPPSFNSSLPLNKTLTSGDQVYFNLSATSEYPSHTTELYAVHEPQKSTFNRKTGIFQWTAIEGEHYVSIEARDKEFNLTSKHDIAFHVVAKSNNSITTLNHGHKTRYNIIVLITSLFGLLFLFTK